MQTHTQIRTHIHTHTHMRTHTNNYGFKCYSAAHTVATAHCEAANDTDVDQKDWFHLFVVVFGYNMSSRNWIGCQNHVFLTSMEPSSPSCNYLPSGLWSSCARIILIIMHHDNCDHHVQRWWSWARIVMSKDDENLSVQPSLSPAAAAAAELGAEMARTSKCKTFLHTCAIASHCIHFRLQSANAKPSYTLQCIVGSKCKTFLHTCAIASHCTYILDCKVQMQNLPTHCSAL